MIVVAKFESCFGEIITSGIVVLIHKAAVKAQTIHATKNIGIIVPEKIDLILSPVKIETVL